MRAQLGHLAELAQLPTVDLMVLPCVAGAHASPGGSFEIFDMAEPYPEIGYVPTPAGEICVQDAEVERLVVAYERLRAAALAGDEAVAFAVRTSRGMR